MKRILYSLIFVSFLFNHSFASTYSNDPKLFVKELVEDAIKTLGDKNIPRADKNKKIEEIALNNVDIEALGMYTLGEIRKSLDSETVKKYQGLFEKYFLKSLTSRLTDYSNQKFEVLSADQKSDNYNIVSSRLVESASQPEIKIDWRIYTKDPSKPLIRDLIVEGLSLARTQKEEFASILNSNNNDINILFSKLEDFIKN
jgi:phospholipid transport system substrate-binding protein